MVSLLVKFPVGPLAASQLFRSCFSGCTLLFCSGWRWGGGDCPPVSIDEICAFWCLEDIAFRGNRGGAPWV